MTFGIRGPVGSTGVGSGTAISMGISISGSPSATSIVIAHGEPSVGTLQTWDLYFREVGALNWTEYATGLTSATQTVADLDPETSYQFYAIGHVLVDTPASYAVASTTESSAPTVPTARQTWNAGWNLSNYAPLELIPEGQRRTFRAVVRNLTGASATGISLDLIQGTAAPSVYDVAVGPRDGETFNATAWQVSQVTIPAAADAQVAPGYLRHVVTLTAPLANDDQLVISIRPANRDVVTSSSLSANSWPTIPFADGTAVSNADIAVDAAWPGGTGNVFAGCTGISFLGLSAPCINIGHIGDSVGSGIPPLADDYALSRGFWTAYGNAAEVANGRRFHWNSVANGTYTIDQYLDRVAHLITTSWIDTIDVVSLQMWTHNQAPGNVASAQAQWAQFEAVADAIRALGRGVIYTILTPPSYAHQTADEVAAWEWMKTQIASLPHVYLDDIVADGTGTAIAPAHSADLVHVNSTSQILQAAVLPTRTATALQALGYTV